MFTVLLVNVLWAGLVVYVLVTTAEERRVLLNRIQAPQETVIREVTRDAGPDPVPVRFDSDEEFYDAIGDGS